MSPLRARQLDHALDAIELITTLVAEGREKFDASIQQQLALAMCWVSVGSQLKQSDRLNDVRTQSFRAPIAMRDGLAYRPLTRMDHHILWDTSVRHAPELAELLRSLRSTAVHE